MNLNLKLKMCNLNIIHCKCHLGHRVDISLSCTVDKCNYSLSSDNVENNKKILKQLHKFKNKTDSFFDENALIICNNPYKYPKICYYESPDTWSCSIDIETDDFYKDKNIQNIPKCNKKRYNKEDVIKEYEKKIIYFFED